MVSRVLLSQTCDILENTQVLNDVRRPVVTESEFATGIKCRLDTIRFRSPEKPDLSSMKTEYHALLYMVPVPYIREDMSIRLNSDIYEIVSIANVSNAQGGSHHLELEVVRKVKA